MKYEAEISIDVCIGEAVGEQISAFLYLIA